MKFELDAKGVLNRLIYLYLFLLCANVLGIVTKFHFGHDKAFGLVPLFDFNQEQNIPTLYSTLLLLGAGFLLSIIALNHKEDKKTTRQWAGLAIIFLLLGIDELSCIHEMFTTPTKSLIDTSGYLYFAWVIPYGIFVLAFCISYLKFLIQLPKETRKLFIISGIVYVGGAIGFEMLGSREAYEQGGGNVIYALLYTCEESLEMIGTTLFIYALLKYMTYESGGLFISVKPEKAHKAPQ